jgi:hypothetical protein
MASFIWKITYVYVDITHTSTHTQNLLLSKRLWWIDMS